MGRHIVRWVLVVWGLLAAGVGTTVSRSSAAEAGPEAMLRDTGTVAADLFGTAAWRSETGWKVVPEDNLTHRFQGDVVLANDRLAVVLRWKGRGAEVYGRAADGWKNRGTLAAAGAEQITGLSNVRIVENNPGAVMVEAAFQTAANQTAQLTYRLTAGQSILEMRGGAGTDRLVVGGESHCVIVPDFFGDDMVFAARPEWAQRTRIGLPAENFLLSLRDNGNAILMCVWQSRQQQATAVFGGEGAGRTIQACEVQCVKGASIWVAVLEGTRQWHEQAPAADAAGQPRVLDWTPPFPAKWRADVLGPGGLAASSYFRSRDEPAEAASAACACSGLGSADCVLDGQRALVQRQPPPAGTKALPAGPVLAYPIDRSQATPLTVFCPMDVLRNTLGVGPCQYILQTEGLASESNPTPETVAAWVEQKFSRKKEKQAADEMRELLDAMVDHVRRADARIGRYGSFAQELRTGSLSAATTGDARGDLRQLSDTADRLQQVAAAGLAAPRSAERAATIAEQIGKLIGKPDALAECRRLGGELRVIGAIQDRTLANCRMTVRWLKQQAQIAAEPGSPIRDAAQQIQTQTEQFLKGK